MRGSSGRVTLLLAASLLAWVGPGASGSARAARVHLVVVGDTDDRKIGENVGADIHAFAWQLKQMGLKSLQEPVVLQGEDCRPERIVKALQDLALQPDDAVVFYYSGHGARDRIHGRFLRFPRLGKEVILPRDTIRDLVAGWVNTRQIRLGVVITDMCSLTKVMPVVAPNQAPAAQAPMLPPIDAPLFTALFVQSRGLVDVNSSEDEQVAVAYPIEVDATTGFRGVKGTFFGEALRDAFRKYRDAMRSWKRILEDRVRPEVAAEFRRLYPEGVDVPDQPGTKQFTQTIRIDSLAESPFVESPDLPPGALGVTLQVVRTRTERGVEQGVEIQQVFPGSPAEGQLRPGNIVLGVDGRPTPTPAALQAALAAAGPVVRLRGQAARSRGRTEVVILQRGDADAGPGPGGNPARLGVNVNLQAYQVTTDRGVELGLKVDSIDPGTPAAGIVDPGDILLSVNGRPTTTHDQLRAAIAAAGPVVQIRGRDFRTGQIVDFRPIPMDGLPTPTSRVMSPPR